MQKDIKTKITRFISLMLIVVAIPIFSGCGGSTGTSYSVSLEIWSPFDDSSVFTSIIDQYKKTNPFIKEIKFKKFSIETYKSELIDALASGNGPDIYLINNSWLPAFENKLSPAPVISTALPQALVSEQNIKDNFPDTVYNDFVDNGNVYAVPLSVDSLQLYYNKDIFNAAAITAPPKNWEEFDSDVKKTTVVNSVGDIVQSGTALGTISNINRSTDILTALMYQWGTVFPTSRKSAGRIADGSVGPDGKIISSSEEALKYYTKFSRLTTDSGAASQYYAWSDRNHYSVDAFTEGTLGMMFNYSWQIKAIQNKNAKLNFGVAPIPQMSSTNLVTSSNYWGFGVSLNKAVTSTASGQSSSTATVKAIPNEARVFEAWQFLRFLTLKNSGTIKIFNAISKTSKDFPLLFDAAQEYIKKTQQAAARRDLIEIQKTDPLLSSFATGNLIAKNWWKQDSDQADTILSDAIKGVNLGNMSARDAITMASTKINLLNQGK